MNHHTLYKHHVNRDTFGRPKREGLAYIRNLAQQKFDFQLECAVHCLPLEDCPLVAKTNARWSIVT